MSLSFCSQIIRSAIVLTFILVAGGAAAQEADQGGMVVMPQTGIIKKVVGGSDQLFATAAPDNTERAFNIEVLQPYFVMEEDEDYYKISDLPVTNQEKASVGNVGYIKKSKVHVWPTREALHFTDFVTSTDIERVNIVAWDDRDRIAQYAQTGDKKFGPVYEENRDTTAKLPKGLRPYPVLLSEKVPTAIGRPKRIFQVLLTTWVKPEAAKVKVQKPWQEVQRALQSVTFCVVFDITGSMEPYAHDMANVIESLVGSSVTQGDLVRMGFVFFRDEGDEVPIETIEPKKLDDAFKVLKAKADEASGGGDAAEPVLDALVHAASRFNWKGGAGQGGARKVAIVVLNSDAKPKTGVLDRSLKAGMTSSEVAEMLVDQSIKTITFQAGPEAGENLIPTLSKLASVTGGEFLSASMEASEQKLAFGSAMKRVLEGVPKEVREEGRAIMESAIPTDDNSVTLLLKVVDADLLNRLRDLAGDYEIKEAGGLLIRGGWMFENEDLMVPKILIEKDDLQALIRFFNALSTTGVDTRDLIDTARGNLQAMIGEPVGPDAPLDELIRKKLGINFQTELLSFNLDYFAGLTPPERTALQKRIQEAGDRLATFFDANVESLDKEFAVWMPVSYLP